MIAPLSPRQYATRYNSAKYQLSPFLLYLYCACISCQSRINNIENSNMVFRSVGIHYRLMGNGINKIYKHLKYESGVDAVSSISGVFYLVMLNNSKWERYLKREHPDFHCALMRQLVACRQQHIFVSFLSSSSTKSWKVRTL